MGISYHHLIKKNEGGEIVSHYIIFDVESKLQKEGDKEIFTPFLWTALYMRVRKNKGNLSYSEKTTWGNDINAFWDFVEEHTFVKSRSILTSHHLEVDFIPMQGVQQLQARGWKMFRYISHNRVIIFEYKKNNKTLIVMNSGNIFSGSIEKMGKILGYPKLTMPESPEINQAWVDYCMTDTLILSQMWKAYIRFLVEHDLGTMQFTIASQAMTAYRHRFMNRPIAIHDNKEVIALERRTYHGGRFQALVFGNPHAEQYYRLDVNSMYAGIMKQEKVPYELIYYVKKGSIEFLRWCFDRDYLVCADLVLEVNEPFLPVMQDGKTVYPVGRVSGGYCTPEIKYALKQGYIKEVGNVSVYRSDVLFSDYVDYFVGLRNDYKQAGNEVFAYICKLFNNSLYGKFGQYGYEDKIIGDSPHELKREEGYDFETGTKTYYLHYNHKIHVVTRKPVAYNSFVAIAAHITSYGRMRLWHFMKTAGLENVYHVATDSLIVNSDGYQRLQAYISNKVGDLKVELVFKDLIVKSVNDMIIDGKEKIKGIPKKAIKLADDLYQITVWKSFNSLLTENDASLYYVKKMIKRLQRPDYRRVLHNGVECNYVYLNLLNDNPTNKDN